MECTQAITRGIAVKSLNRESREWLENQDLEERADISLLSCLLMKFKAKSLCQNTSFCWEIQFAVHRQFSH